jgi:hypothetical protein
MKVKNAILIFSLTLAFSKPGNSCFGQSKAVPAPVSSNFSTMFPQADHVQWFDKPECYQAIFSCNNMKCEAKFQPDGKWLNSERQILTDSLPKAVKDGLRSSPYAGWSVLKTFVFLLPESIRQYRVVVSNSESIRKILSFNQQGSLIKD